MDLETLAFTDRQVFPTHIPNPIRLTNSLLFLPNLLSTITVIQTFLSKAHRALSAVNLPMAVITSSTHRTVLFPPYLHSLLNLSSLSSLLSSSNHPYQQVLWIRYNPWNSVNQSFLHSLHSLHSPVLTTYPSPWTFPPLSSQRSPETSHHRLSTPPPSSLSADSCSMGFRPSCQSATSWTFCTPSPFSQPSMPGMPTIIQW